MTLVALLIAVCASAQVYVGGNFGIASVDNEGGENDETIFSFLPEIGYKFNSDWALGANFGWSKADLSNFNGSFNYDGRNLTAQTFEINPYVRYTFVHGKLLNVFCDGSFGYKHFNGEGDQYSVGLKPGVELKLDRFSLVARVGFLGWQQYKAKDERGGNKTSVWGLDVDGNNISLGVLYNF